MRAFMSDRLARASERSTLGRLRCEYELEMLAVREVRRILAETDDDDVTSEQVDLGFDRYEPATSEALACAADALRAFVEESHENR